jgi:hypothetical protein
MYAAHPYVDIPQTASQIVTVDVILQYSLQIFMIPLVVRG